MKVNLIPVAAGQAHDYFEFLADSLDAENAGNVIVRGGFAYASLGGVQRFLSVVESRKNWKRVRKEFLIGVHHAISEPSALETLRKVDRPPIFVPATMRVWLPIVAPL